MPADYSAMGDAELVRLCGTRVMGFAWWRDGGRGYDGPYPMATQAEVPDLGVAMTLSPGVHIYMSEDNDPEYFDPLTSDADAFALVDAIQAKGEKWFRLMSHWDKVSWSAGWTEINFTGWNGRMDIEVTDTNRRRAICIAALMATESEGNA